MHHGLFLMVGPDPLLAPNRLDSKEIRVPLALCGKTQAPIPQSSTGGQFKAGSSISPPMGPRGYFGVHVGPRE